MSTLSSKAYQSSNAYQFGRGFTITNVLSSTSFFPVTSTRVSAVSPCTDVDLSTETGAACKCGKFILGPGALPIKTMTLAEVRQVVASGYKLAHGSSVGALRWK